MKKNLFFGALFATLLLASCDSKEEGTIPGVFSVSETQQVKFSSGNLQYSKTAGTLQFAEHQWVVLGGERVKWDEKDVFDVFGWGTGDNPTYERCEEDAKFVDWGTQPIANGGEYKWRTLSPKEWEYVILGRPNALNLIAYGTVENVRGVILLPDAWEQPKDVQFQSLADTAKIDYNMIDVKNRSAETDLTVLNVYDAATWQKMEDAGAVFLPYTIWSFSKEDGLPTGAEYWSTEDSHLSISQTCIWPDRGCVVDAFEEAVRLVKDVEKK
ncbi:MAG: hypothetical protein J6M19_03085 [Bacteroidaceae bacterium]|nr:hypothetical protein [Bacteroidaceae bacterium]